jgi:hypothetical protein
MPDTTKIVFSDGVEVAVEGQAKDLQRVLGKAKRKGEPFALCKTNRRANVYVAADRVAYIEAMPEPSAAALTGRRKQSRRMQPTLLSSTQR